MLTASEKAVSYVECISAGASGYWVKGVSTGEEMRALLVRAFAQRELLSVWLKVEQVKAKTAVAAKMWVSNGFEARTISAAAPARSAINVLLEDAYRRLWEGSGTDRIAYNAVIINLGGIEEIRIKGLKIPTATHTGFVLLRRIKSCATLGIMSRTPRRPELSRARKPSSSCLILSTSCLCKAGCLWMSWMLRAPQVFIRESIYAFQFNDKLVFNQDVGMIVADSLSFVEYWKGCLRLYPHLSENQLSEQRSLINLLQESNPKHIGNFVGASHHSFHQRIKEFVFIRVVLKTFVRPLFFKRLCRHLQITLVGTRFHHLWWAAAWPMTVHSWLSSLLPWPAGLLT